METEDSLLRSQKPTTQFLPTYYSKSSYLFQHYEIFAVKTVP